MLSVAQIPQSTVADKINEEGLIYLYYNQDKFHPVELLLQVHDSIGFQIPLSLPWEDHAKILLQLKESLETPLKTDNGIEFTIPVDFVMGTSLYKEDGIEFKHNKIPNSISSFAEALENAHEKIKD